MIEVHVRKRPPTVPVRPRWARDVALAATGLAPIAHRARHGGEVGLVLTDAREMARVNALHLGHAGPTDVITFDYSEGPAADGPLRGEILICPEVAAQHARRYRTSVELELVRYVVHGLLHLCGYDDQRPDQRRAMKRCEDRLVRSVALTVDRRGLRSGDGA